MYSASVSSSIDGCTNIYIPGVYNIIDHSFGDDSAKPIQDRAADCIRLDIDTDSPVKTEAKPSQAVEWQVSNSYRLRIVQCHNQNQDVAGLNMNYVQSNRYTNNW